jgi:hypothetical protein
VPITANPLKVQVRVTLATAFIPIFCEVQGRQILIGWKPLDRLDIDSLAYAKR